MSPGALLPIVFVALALAGGCGTASRERYELSGSITYGGQPVARGDIVFAPDHARGNTGPGTQADIIDGRYHVSKKEGVVGGPHVVTITGFDGKPITIEGEVIPFGTRLFGDHRVSVDLPHEDSVKDFEVPASSKKS